MLELAGAGSRAKIAEIFRFWRSVFCTAGRSACLGYCAQQRGACGGLNVQRPMPTSNASTLARIVPPCILRSVFPHRAFAALVLLAAALVFPAPVQGAHRPPNVIFILTDNQGAWTLGCYGNKDIRMPNINPLAAEGIRFTRAELQSRVLANGRDPHERFNLFGQPAQANTQRALADKLDEFFKRQADPKYDMWNSVRSKAGALK